MSTEDLLAAREPSVAQAHGRRFCNDPSLTLGNLPKVVWSKLLKPEMQLRGPGLHGKRARNALPLTDLFGKEVSDLRRLHAAVAEAANKTVNTHPYYSALAGGVSSGTATAGAKSLPNATYADRARFDLPGAPRSSGFRVPGEAEVQEWLNGLSERDVKDGLNLRLARQAF